MLIVQRSFRVLTTNGDIMNKIETLINLSIEINNARDKAILTGESFDQYDNELAVLAEIIDSLT